MSTCRVACEEEQIYERGYIFVPLRESKDSMAAVMGEKDRLISRSKYSMDVRCNNTRAHGGTVQTRPSTSRHGRRVPHGKELPDVICITQVRFHLILLGYNPQSFACVGPASCRRCRRLRTGHVRTCREALQQLV